MCGRLTPAARWRAVAGEASVILKHQRSAHMARQHISGRVADWLVRSVVVVSVAGMFAACSDSLSSSQVCPLELDSGCWTLLGLESEWIAEVAVTPWGLFAGTNDHGIFRLESDGGWTALGPQAWHNHLIPKALLYVPADPPRLLAGVTFRNGSKEDTTSAAVFASFDRGESWVPFDGGLATESRNPYRVFVDDLEVDPGNAQRVFMSNCHGVLRSLDAGETWQFVFGSFNICAWHVDILIDPARTGLLWVAGQGNIFVPFVVFSTDWGETWDAGVPTCNSVVVETPTNALALAPNVPDRLFLGAELGLMQSDEAGARGSWDCAAGPRGAVAGFAELNDVLYAATVFLEFEKNPDGTFRELTDLGWYRTTNGGASWDSLAVPRGALGATGTATAVDAAHGRLLVGTRAGLWAVTPP